MGGMVLGLVAIIFYAVGVATKSWVVADASQQNIRNIEMGLFEYCEDDFCRGCKRRKTDRQTDRQRQRDRGRLCVCGWVWV